MPSQAKVRIDTEFESLIPAMTSEEFEGLEKQLLADGCRDPFVVWGNHQNTLLDGHHRYKLCVKHGLPYPVPHKLEFESRDEAKNWTIHNQLSRRNVTIAQRAYLIGKLYVGQKNAHGGDRKSDETPTKQGAKSSAQVEHLKTAEKIAEQENVAPATVKRAGEFAEAVDAIEEKLGKETKAAILEGDLKISQPQATQLAALPAPKAKQAVKRIERGEKAKDVLPKPPKKPKAGKPTFDDRKVEKTFGQLVRLIDDRAAAYGGQGNHHGACMTDLNEFHADWKAWQKAGRGAK